MASWPRAQTVPPVVHHPAECTDVTRGVSRAEQADLAHEHRLFRIYPPGNDTQGYIRDFPRQIPFSKGDVPKKFGTTKLDVFRYEFYKVVDENDEEKNKHLVMWEYRLGLVRITPMFKALGLGKVAPKAALDANRDLGLDGLPQENTGLIDISASVTGGAIVAQGYWIDIDCAREMCSTFCYEIRFALTPVFGVDFIKQCLHPDHLDFGTYKVSTQTLDRAKSKVHAMRAPALVAQPAASTTSRAQLNSAVSQASRFNYSTSRTRAPPRQRSRKPQEPKRDLVNLSDPAVDEEDDEDMPFSSAHVSQDSPQTSPVTISWTSINRPNNLIGSSTSTTNHRRSGSRYPSSHRSSLPSNHFGKRPIPSESRVARPDQEHYIGHHEERSPAAKRLRHHQNEARTSRLVRSTESVSESNDGDTPSQLSSDPDTLSSSRRASSSRRPASAREFSPETWAAADILLQIFDSD